MDSDISRGNRIDSLERIPCMSDQQALSTGRHLAYGQGREVGRFR